MAKYSNPSKLSSSEQRELLIQLCRVIAKLNSPIEAAKFLKDILTAQEAEMLAKRLKVAERLMAGDTYARISFDFKISPSTIFRIHEWLKISGDGFRLGLAKIAKEKFDKEYFNNSFDSPWRDLKKKFPLYFWPQILLENVVRSANKRDRQRIEAVLDKIDKKTRLHKRLYRLLMK
ncbi:hypothetical protein KJ866_01950 [Patescibacteria group bacterium]|nr:hypothetical protein [Patescibacteria group bacterium]MBU2219975.1 hypothetical protein [Patescibacteria group bacterium]